MKTMSNTSNASNTPKISKFNKAMAEDMTKDFARIYEEANDPARLERKSQEEKRRVIIKERIENFNI